MSHRSNTSQEEMIWFLYCYYLNLKSGGTDTGGQPSVIVPAATYAAAQALATGLAKFIIVAVDETDDGAKNTYFWDGTTLANILKIPPLLKKDKLDLDDPEFSKDPVTLSFFENAIQVLQDAIDAISNNNSQDILALFDQLKALAYPTMDPSWNAIDVITTGVSASGATINTSEGTISIPTGSTGSGTYLRKDFKVDSNPLNQPGDIITFEVIMRESFVGALNPFVKISLYKNNTLVPNIEVTAVQMESKVLQYLFDYVIDEAGDDLAVRVSMDAGSPIATANIIYTWNSLAYTNPKERHGTLMEKVAETLRNADTMYTFFSRRARTSKANIYNTIDNAALLQDEIYDAVQTSGVLLMPKNATMFVGSPLIINGGLLLIGAGISTIFNTALNGTLFQFATNDDIQFQNFQIYRLTGAFTAKAIEFSDQYANKRSVFENVVFTNMQNPVSVNYAENVLFDRCQFNAGINCIDIGEKSSQSVRDVTVRNCRFNSFSGIGVSSNTGNDITVADSQFYAVAGTNIYNARGVYVGSADHVAENVIIRDNKFKYFREYGIRLAAGATGKLNNVEVKSNKFEDRSSVSSSTGIYATSANAGSFDGLNIHDNEFKTKGDAIIAQTVNNIRIRNNEFKNMDPLNPATYPSARGIHLINCPDPKVIGNEYGSNLLPNQL